MLLISTDPASNLQDVFNTELTNKGVPIKEVPNLVVTNLDPIQAAAEYRESVIAPYRGKLPDNITGMDNVRALLTNVICTTPIKRSSLLWVKVV